MSQIGKKIDDYIRSIGTIDINEEENSKNWFSIENKMINIWKENVGLNSYIDECNIRNLVMVFKTKFNSNFEEWLEYCNKIRKNSFLMGKNSDWKATLKWAIKEDNIDKILSDFYNKQEGFSSYGLSKKSSNKRPPDEELFSQDDREEYNCNYNDEDDKKFRAKLLKIASAWDLRFYFYDIHLKEFVKIGPSNDKLYAIVEVSMPSMETTTPKSPVRYALTNCFDNCQDFEFKYIRDQ